jgi:hypothetical protein
MKHWLALASIAIAERRCHALVTLTTNNYWNKAYAADNGYGLSGSAADSQAD